jgi:signal transduction histidine kinase
VAIAGRGELSELSRAFNDMTGRIREMIKSREQLLLDVSHELKSPLTRIKVALELGKENLPAVVRRNVGEMETMVTELLETARLDSGRGSLSLAPVDLSELLRDVVQPFLETGPGVRVEAPAGHSRVEADAKRVRAVIRNLVENALKHSAHQDRPVEASLRERGGRLELVVRDSGYGIPASDLDSVFEPFYRVDKSRNKDSGGYGLGLSLCRKIMEAHGGGISLESEEGRGTTATAWFRI